MPGSCCVVPGCQNRGGHEFPADKERSKEWVIAIKRITNNGKLWQPTSSSVVCKSHFKADDYEEKNSRGYMMQVKRLKPTAVPSQFPWTKRKSDNDLARDHRVTKRRTSNNTTKTVQSYEMFFPEDNLAGECEVLSEPSKQCTSVQTEPGPTFESTTTQTVTRYTGLNINDIKSDSELVKFYTGLENYQMFFDVFNSLGSASYNLHYMYGFPNISEVNQFFLTLIKLRTYKTNFELARMFEIKESEVYNIFITWVRFMSLQWQEIDTWPDRDIVHFFSPSDFKRKFPSTRVIVDGTEIPVQKPKAPAVQQITFSKYKNRNTAKVLIGITPGGLVSYISPAYGGSASDRQITERSTLMAKCDPTDSIMADKGFDVQDIFAPYDVRINLPTFFKKKNRMSGDVVLKDRSISSKRVHVERVIGNAKKYKILCHPLNHTEMVLSSDIIFICFMLTNFRNCIVSKFA